jgi:hypothetical protein
MPSHSDPVGCTGRRGFLKQVSAVAVAGMATGGRAAESIPQRKSAATLPMISLGEHRVSRLVVGSNTINGYSYMGPHADQHMREYFTLERTVEFLQQCEREGINTFQFSVRPETLASIEELRRRGSRMQLICLHSERAGIAETVAQTRPIGMVHHGGATDRLFAQGRAGEVHDYVKQAHDAGVLAGVSAHNPDCIRRIADEGWEVDFFMNCFYFLTRALVPETKASVEALPTLEIVYPFYKNDPQVMIGVMRQVDQPCLAFKILAAGRLCTSQNAVKAAFEFAFRRIKPRDGVIIGMYPRFFDEVQANAEYTRQFAVVTG